MTQKSIRVVALIMCLYFHSYSQPDNVWLFGLNAGLNFSVAPPQFFSGGQSSIPDNSSSISDKFGNLLFYTDGVTVWNKNHQPMANGSGLNGNYTAGQCALIVPIPCSESEYLIFHPTEFASPGNLSYTKVNMTLGNGLGDVVSMSKNISLGSGWTEKLCAIYNPLGNNFWVLTHRWNTAEFVAFSVTSGGLSAQSVTSTIGSVHNCGVYSAAHDAMGQLTISRNGTKVINALTCKDRFELFDFNMTTGALSNPIELPSVGSAWGTAFSPDNSKVYVNSIFGDYVLQYDISNYNQKSVQNSSVTLISTGQPGYNFGYMEMGPDDKLYIPRPGTTVMSVVNQPNLPGTACGFAYSGLSTGSISLSHGISRIAYNTPTGSAGNIFASVSPTSICKGGTFTLTAIGGANYFWSSPISSSSYSVTFSPLASTVVYLTGTDGCGITSNKSINLVVNSCVVGIDEQRNSPFFKVYPTIFQKQFFIEYHAESVIITVQNSLGKILYSNETQPGSRSIAVDLDFCTTGCYYVSVKSEQQTSTFTVFKIADD